MTTPNPVSILATERHTIHSKVTGIKYEISIALPYAYVRDPEGAGPFYKTLDAWPVVYLTDANWHFGMVTDFVREAAWCGRSFDAIVVGIGYAGGSLPQQDWLSVSVARSLDLTPKRLEAQEVSEGAWLQREIKTGGGAGFLSFLKEELLPWVEKEYRADAERRILAGHSYGGLFSLYAMLQEPGLFRSYIAASPFLNDPDRTIFAMEREFAKNHKDVPAQLYLAAGELEESADDMTLTDMYRIGGLLESRGYPGLQVTKQVFADNNHCEAATPALHAGLKLALRRGNS